MPLLTKEEAQAILKKALSYSKADECTVSLGGTEGGNIRYARNAVSTAGDVTSMSLGVTSAFGKKTGTATINEFDDTQFQCLLQRWRLALDGPVWWSS